MSELATSDSSGRGRRWWVALPLVALLLALSWVAMGWGLASGYGTLAELTLSQWSRQDLRPDADLIERTERRLQQAQAWDSGNPRWLEAQGRLNELQTLTQRLPAAQRRALQRQAQDHYLAAAMKRPLWPYTWANLSLVQYRDAGASEPFQTSLERALRAGPWEPRIHLTAARLGFAAWEMLDADSRELLLASMGRGMRRDWDRIIEMSARSGRLYFACDNLPLIEPAQRLCERYGWSPLPAQSDDAEPAG